MCQKQGDNIIKIHVSRPFQTPLCNTLSLLLPDSKKQNWSHEDISDSKLTQKSKPETRPVSASKLTPADDKPNNTAAETAADNRDGTNVDITLATDIETRPKTQPQENNSQIPAGTDKPVEHLYDNAGVDDSVPVIELHQIATEKLASEDSLTFLPNGRRVCSEDQQGAGAGAEPLRVKSEGVYQEGDLAQTNILSGIASTYPPPQHDDCSLTDQLEPTRQAPIVPPQQAGEPPS